MAESSSSGRSSSLSSAERSSTPSSECSDSSETEKQRTATILNTLRSPSASDLARKRKVQCNLPHDGKRYRAPKASCNPKSMSPSVRLEEFPGENLAVSSGYARDHEPCIIFMDEIDAIGGRRFSEGTSADREIQRTLMELLNQMDGFDALGQVKIIMATNRPDTLDPALLRPGRLDRKIEIPLPNEQARMDILKIHSSKITKHGDIDYEAVVKLSDGFNGADLRNVCTEAGMFAIRAERDYVIEEDFMKAARKVADNKKLESKLDYKPV